MKILSVNVGLPREVLFGKDTVTTGIFKEPVEGRVKLRILNLDGDKQADLTVHGGEEKAVYAYPKEHYEYWQREFPNIALPWGMFGENLTTEGLSEDVINIGDRFRIGSAEVVATQPRIPCYKLGVKFGRMDVVRRFLTSGRPGVYFKVLLEGEVEAGESIELVSKAENNITVKDILRLYVKDNKDIESMQRAITVKDLPIGWRNHFREQIKQLTK
ncbi:MAG: MOSC domain-containing protein [Candidatus Nitrosopolaris sp.]|jgi:MOSC domain-containing protein YiiM